MGIQQCCVATGDTQRRDETELLTLARIHSADQHPHNQLAAPTKTLGQQEFMNRIVSDASRRVRELKRQQTLAEESSSEEWTPNGTQTRKDPN